MATGGSNVLTQLCEELLCCDICTEDFDFKTHTPRILPCYHSFCGTCVEQLTKDDSVECPKCRRVAQVSGKLPMDTTRIALLDKRRALQSQEGVSCEGCTEGAKATSRCQDCAELLCEDCCAAHIRVKYTKNHTLVSLTEAAENPDKILQSNEKCERHSEKKLRMFCLSCSTAVCTICILTQHQDGHKFVEISSVLDKKKQEILSLCEQLDKVEQSFQAKAEESEASLEVVKSNLNEAVQEAESFFGEIIRSATERQAEVIGELRAVAKSDGLLLEEQAATFRSMQAATHTAAQYGRTCVSLSLASQIFSQNPELQKTVRELKRKAKAVVIPAPRHKVVAGRLAELQGLLKEMGKIESQVARKNVILPSIQLDSSRCGAGCRVGADRCSLSNQPCTPSPSQPQTQRFRFPGTCGTQALPAGCSYWQVRCAATATRPVKTAVKLCEFGVATQQALEAHPGDVWSISETGAAFAGIHTVDGHVKAWAHGMGQYGSTHLPPLTSSSGGDVTLGLLLNTAKSQLHFIDVRATTLLWSSYFKPSSPMWPFVRVFPEQVNGPVVAVKVQSSSLQVGMSLDLIRLVLSLL